LAVTRCIQPLLPVVARQHDVLPGQGPGGNGGADAARVVANFGLTARDTAVLQLLTEGLTAGAIGSRLAITMRPVQVHLSSASFSAAIRRRIFPANVRGRTVASHALACEADRSLLSCPGTRHGVRGFSRLAHIDELIRPNPPYVRLPRVHCDETRTQGLDRLVLIRFLQDAQPSPSNMAWPAWRQRPPLTVCPVVFRRVITRFPCRARGTDAAIP
jgi:DNA-binding CsgD family transcriptional regulator